MNHSKQQVLVVAQGKSFLDLLGPVELARDLECGKDRDAKVATHVYDQFHSISFHGSCAE